MGRIQRTECDCGNPIPRRNTTGKPLYYVLDVSVCEHCFDLFHERDRTQKAERTQMKRKFVETSGIKVRGMPLFTQSECIPCDIPLKECKEIAVSSRRFWVKRGMGVMQSDRFHFLDHAFASSMTEETVV